MRFLHPWVLSFLVLIPVLVWYYYFSGVKRRMSIRYSDVSRMAPQQAKSLEKRAWYAPMNIASKLEILKIAAVFFLILSLARPQWGEKERNVVTEGYDIIMTLDTSDTMQMEDFKPNRLEAAKANIAKFVRARQSDRIGLVVYAGESFTQAPLTLDYNMLLQALKQVSLGMMEDTRTAIGMAIANSVNRLRASKSKSKLIILLTDGVNNSGAIDPLTAAKIAQAMDIKIYTIGVGTKVGNAQWDLDEDLLREIASTTGGKYFRASDPQALDSVYATINRLEKTKFKVKEYVSYNEAYSACLVLALLLLCLYFVLSRFVLVSIP